MARKIIPDYKVKQWLEAGHTNGEIVADLAQEDIFVTPQAISAWAQRNGMRTATRQHTGYPWPIREEHRQMLPTRAIQWFNRREAGDTLPPSAERRLNWVLDRLVENDAVFHYEPNTAEGWWTVVRRPGDHTMYRNIDINPVGDSEARSTVPKRPLTGSVVDADVLLTIAYDLQHCFEGEASAEESLDHIDQAMRAQLPWYAQTAMPRERVEEALSAETLDNPTADRALDVIVGELLPYLDRHTSELSAFQDSMTVLDETGRL